MKGYRKEPDKTAEAIDADGWLHTGDIGPIDDDGYFPIVDRKKEMIINAAGKNMSPANIENAIKGACLIDRAEAHDRRRPTVQHRVAGVSTPIRSAAYAARARTGRRVAGRAGRPPGVRLR